MLYGSNSQQLGTMLKACAIFFIVAHSPQRFPGSLPYVVRIMMIPICSRRVSRSGEHSNFDPAELQQPLDSFGACMTVDLYEKAAVTEP